MQAPSSPSGVPVFPAQLGGLCSRPTGCPLGGRQLRHPQASQGAHLAGTTASFPHALHPHLLVVAESGGTLVRSDYAASHSAWFLPQCQGTGAEDRRLRKALQPQTATFYLDSNRRFHSPEDRPTLLTYFRDATLGRLK